MRGEALDAALLREIQDLLTLRVAPGARCSDVRERTEAKIADVEAKIRSLRFKRLRDECTGEGPTSECPILDAIERNLR